MARRTKEDAEKTRLQLLETALALFSEKGIANVTLAQIASTAGVTRGLFTGTLKTSPRCWKLSGQGSLIHSISILPLSWKPMMKIHWMCCVILVSGSCSGG